jgi:hypothetical protein
MPEYHVTWEIELNADSPCEAAVKALAIQRDPDSIATVFDVTDKAGTTEQIDLAEVEEEESDIACTRDEERAIDAAVTLLRAQPLVDRAVCFIDQVSAHLRDGECFACGQDGHESNPACAEHDQEPFELSYDEAFDTLHSFISEARTLSTEIENLKRSMK